MAPEAGWGDESRRLGAGNGRTAVVLGFAVLVDGTKIEEPRPPRGLEGREAKLERGVQGLSAGDASGQDAAKANLRKHSRGRKTDTISPNEHA